MSRKDAVNALFKIVPPSPASLAPAPVAPERKSGAELVLGAPNTVGERVRAGAVGAFAGSLKELTGETDALRAQLAAGETVVKIDPSLIDPAPVADRLRGADDVAIEDLKASMASVGQQVPVLVRPHPSRNGRYQAAYGHRRIRAARDLDIPVSAIVRMLDDEQLAIAQGQENIARRDLSFIEKAFFAQGLEVSGLPRAAVIKALATDKGDLSRYISVAAAMPIALVQRIGPAPKAGRARWLALASALAAAGGGEPPVLQALYEKQAFQGADSDSRFQLALSVLESAAAQTIPASGPASSAVIKAADGQHIAQMSQGRRSSVFTISDADAPGFAAFLAEALPALHQRWRDGRAGIQT